MTVNYRDAEKAATIAAGWWVDRLSRRPDRDEYTVADWERITPEQLRRFSSTLALGVMLGLAWPGTERPEVRLRVDYHPEGLLLYAAQEAGLPDVFPSKTIMRAQADLVWVRDGYGAPRSMVWWRWQPVRSEGGR